MLTVKITNSRSIRIFVIFCTTFRTLFSSQL